MKAILTIAAAICALSATQVFAQGNPQDKAAAQKQEALANVDARIAELNNLKSCISGASTADAMKGCREKHREAAQNFRAQHMQERIEKMQTRKAELDQKIQQAKQVPQMPK